MNKHTMKVEWIDREKVETVIIDVDPRPEQIHKKKLFLYLKSKSPLKQKRELKRFSIFRRFSKSYKSKFCFRY